MDGTVLIDGADIAWVGPADAAPERPSGARVLDGSGSVVLPGMVNTHTHAGLSTWRGLADDQDFPGWVAAIAPHTSVLSVEDVRRGAAIAVDAMLDAGVTCACDCTRYGAGEFSDAASSRGLRSLSGALANSPELRPVGRPNWPLALEETDAAMAAHSGDPLARFYLGAHAPYSCTPDLVREIDAEARQRGLPFVIHLAETQREAEELRNATGLSPARWLDATGALRPGTLLAHGVWLDDDDLDLIAERGAAVAHCPTSNAKLASGIAPLLAMRDRGITVGLGTDSMLSNNGQDVLHEARQASLLQRIRHERPWMPEAAALLRAATIDGARALSWDDRIGSLEIGKAADLIVFTVSHPRGLTLDRVRSDLLYSLGRADLRLVMTEGLIRRHRRSTESTTA
ncbi:MULTISPECIES: amidohydrolase family protein [unclassified Rathayibacter]|uniref:amidohydrolase family protein n=1 Tax=unclassified Rathayibacter TaxID=2609250 RepID=UPI0016159375|nr:MULTISPECIES: amidohydrolase family protein [unclassified Rathayibacter]